MKHKSRLCHGTMLQTGTFRGETPVACLTAEKPAMTRAAGQFLPVTNTALCRGQTCIQAQAALAQNLKCRAPVVRRSDYREVCTMACNGFGHPPECNCGWGGEFHPSPGGLFIANRWLQRDSYTTPNAQCPVCAQQVFFYQSPAGGRVYFDELGPPWPKHSCTDKAGRHRQQLGERFQKKEGWWPLIWDEVIELRENEGSVLIDSQKRPLFLRVPFPGSWSEAPVYMRAVPGGEGVYELSTLRTRKGKTREVLFTAYGNKALTIPSHAQHFPALVKLVNDFYGYTEDDEG